MVAVTNCEVVLPYRVEPLCSPMNISLGQKIPIDEQKPKSHECIKRSQSIPVAFDMIDETCLAYSRYLGSCDLLLTQLMTEYQSQATTHDEIARGMECLCSINDMERYFGRRARRVCVFLPLHMPIFNLVSLCIVPSLMADEVYIYPPKELASTFRKLLAVLELKHFFPNIIAVDDEESQFIEARYDEDYVSDAEITIFAGKLEDAREVSRRTKQNSLFIFVGSACNPVVVGPDANVDLAVFKTAELKTRNSGQHDGGPSAILVHDSLIDEFLDLLKMELDLVKVGSYSDPGVTVGPLIEDEAVMELAYEFGENRDNIKYGGKIDFVSSIVHPTVVVFPLGQKTNLGHMSAPVFFINTYTDDSELRTYFENLRYATSEMFVTLFGRSDHVKGRLSSIFLGEQIVLDIPRGNGEYGGSGHGVSFASLNGVKIAERILIPREIFNFLETFVFLEALPTQPAELFSSDEETELDEETKLTSEILSSSLSWPRW